MVNVNDFKGQTDIEIIENAIANKTADGIVVFSPRSSAEEPEREYWLIDRAICIPENTTVILQNCKIKLSDKCRDNFFRSANCGMGIEFPEKIKNIHIRGEGLCVLEGADHPRAVGDGGKVLQNPCPYLPEDICKYATYVPEDRRKSGKLEWSDFHANSYGTDAGKEGESQYGDWRGIGVLFANVEDFSIENLRIVESHGWSISLEACSNGKISKIDFDNRMYKEIDGMLMNMENQDGLDIRNGCHDLIISDITGQAGDDVIALTAIAGTNYRPGGSLRSTHVMHNDWSKRDKDIHDIVIRNVVAHSYHCYAIRLLPAKTKIYNIVIDGVIDTETKSSHECHGTILLGDDGDYGENFKESMRNISISNVICGSSNGPVHEGAAIDLKGYLVDSVINNVVNRNYNQPVLRVSREDGMTNVITSNLVSVQKKL